MYITASNLSLFSARLIQSSQNVLLNVHFNDTIWFNVFKAVTYPQVFPSKLCIHFSSIRATQLTHLVQLCNITRQQLDQYKS